MFRTRALVVMGFLSSLGITGAFFGGSASAACWSPTTPSDTLLIDVELEQDGFWATWQVDPIFDSSGNYTPGAVCVAPIDPTSGMLLLNETACPDGAHPRNRVDTANGPEWARSLRGPEPFFSAYPLDPNSSTGVNLQGIQIRKLSSVGGAWAAYDAPNTLKRGRVRPNIDRYRDSPRFHMREFLNCQASGCDATDRAFWRFDTTSSAEYPLPDGVRRARWLEDSAVMAFLRKNAATGNIEAVAYSTVTRKEEIVVSDAREKTHVLIFNAPDFGDRMTVLVNVLDPSTNVFELEVYVRAGKGWRFEETIPNISNSYPTLNSPEVFVLNGQSYVAATSTGRIDGLLQSVVWFASIGDLKLIQRIVSQEFEEVPTQKVDPEPLVLLDDQGNPSSAIIYYVDTGTTWRYLACETGL